jgi:hypothetical protein
MRVLIKWLVAHTSRHHAVEQQGKDKFQVCQSFLYLPSELYRRIPGRNGAGLVWMDRASTSPRLHFDAGLSTHSLHLT